MQFLATGMCSWQTNLTFSENPQLRALFLQQIYVLKNMRNDVINMLWNQTKTEHCILFCEQLLIREEIIQVKQMMHKYAHLKK